MRNKIIQTALTAIMAMGVSSLSMAAESEADKTAATGASTTTESHHKLQKGMEKCYGIARAGLNDCGTSTNNGCAGSSKVDGERSAWIFVPVGTCNKIVGSSTKES